MTGTVARMSNFNGGFSSGLTVRGLPLAVAHPGKVFFVSDTGLADYPGRKTPSNSNNGSFSAPFATIEYAMSQTLANRGDIIFVLPGHTETVTTDGGLALDVAGVAVVGLGTGTLRPLILLDSAAAAAVTVTADNISLVNFELRASFADVTNAIDVTAAWFAIDNCEFTEEGANLNFLDYIHCSSTTNNTSDGLSVTNCVGTAIDAAQNSFINIKADLDRLYVENVFYSSDNGATLAAILCATGKDLTDCFIKDLYVYSGATAVDIAIDNDTAANTGIVKGVYGGHHDVALEAIVDLDGVRVFDVFSNATDTTSGYALPGPDS